MHQRASSHWLPTVTYILGYPPQLLQENRPIIWIRNLLYLVSTRVISLSLFLHSQILQMTLRTGTCEHQFPLVGRSNMFLLEQLLVDCQWRQVLAGTYPFHWLPTVTSTLAYSPLQLIANGNQYSCVPTLTTARKSIQHFRRRNLFFTTLAFWTIAGDSKYHFSLTENRCNMFLVEPVH